VVRRLTVSRSRGIEIALNDTILTVGHSNGSAQAFVRRLLQAGVEVVADVRSQPRSLFAPQFDESNLKESLDSSGIRYVSMGRELGGRPSGEGMYDKDGHVLYHRVAASDRFQEGIDRLIAGSRDFRVAVMCTEEDPVNCHRRLLVGRVLKGRGVEVQHLRGNGTVESEPEVAERELLRYPERFQEALFGEKETEWRSIRSVSGGTRHPSSSGS
jgi:uncharacterized protein (DUF488 family)